MHRIASIAILALTSLAAVAQSIPICGQAGKNSISFDYNRLWDYNQYEYSRWGVGLRIARFPKQGPLQAIYADPYIAYGTHDRQWKGGLTVSGQLSGTPRLNNLMIGYAHDYFGVGSRRIDNPAADGGQLLGSFMARRMTRQDRWMAAYRLGRQRTSWMIAAMAYRRAYLFDDSRLLFLHEGDTLPHHQMAQLRLVGWHERGWHLQADLLHDFSRPDPATGMRFLADYRHTFTFGHTKLNTYLQGGLSSHCLSYADLFDIGGSYGTSLYIGQAFCTLRVNEFTVHRFLLGSLRLQTVKPLFSYYNRLFSVGTNPVPFATLTVAWGQLHRANAEGQTVVDGIQLQSPHRGIAEAMVGMEGLVRWGAVDFGIAYAFRIAPTASPYHLSPSDRNRMFLFTATLLQ